MSIFNLWYGTIYNRSARNFNLIIWKNIHKRNFNPFSPNCLSLLWTFSRARTFHNDSLLRILFFFQLHSVYCFILEFGLKLTDLFFDNHYPSTLQPWVKKLRDSDLDGTKLKISSEISPPLAMPYIEIQSNLAIRNFLVTLKLFLIENIESKYCIRYT